MRANGQIGSFFSSCAVLMNEVKARHGSDWISSCPIPSCLLSIQNFKLLLFAHGSFLDWSGEVVVSKYNHLVPVDTHLRVAFINLRANAPYPGMKQTWTSLLLTKLFYIFVSLCEYSLYSRLILGEAIRIFLRQWTDFSEPIKVFLISNIIVIWKLKICLDHSPIFTFLHHI